MQFCRYIWIALSLVATAAVADDTILTCKHTINPRQLYEIVLNFSTQEMRLIRSQDKSYADPDHNQNATFSALAKLDCEGMSANYVTCLSQKLRINGKAAQQFDFIQANLLLDAKRGLLNNSIGVNFMLGSFCDYRFPCDSTQAAAPGEYSCTAVGNLKKAIKAQMKHNRCTEIANMKDADFSALKASAEFKTEIERCKKLGWHGSGRF